MNQQTNTSERYSLTMARLEALDSIVPSEKVSSKYKHINTVDIVRALDAEGFRMTSVAKARRGSSHIVRLRHQDARPVASSNPSLHGLVPEIVLRSAYDGTSALTISAGVFRIVCSNGLVVGNGLVERILHVGDAIDKARIATARIVAEQPKVIDGVERLGAVTLTAEQQLDFARKASDIVLGPDQLRSDSTARYLLNPKRSGDALMDLWTTFNVVQENAMSGRYAITKSYPIVTRSGERILAHGLQKGRAINSVDRVFEVNKALWNLADSFAA